jgi:hypothetical protein
MTAQAFAQDKSYRRSPPDRRRARRRPKETDEVAKAVERFLRALGRRVADGDPDQLRLLAQIEEVLRRAQAEAVSGLRAQGWSDALIGAELGVTCWAVRKRWPRGGGPDGP